MREHVAFPCPLSSTFSSLAPRCSGRHGAEGRAGGGSTSQETGVEEPLVVNSFQEVLLRASQGPSPILLPNKNHAPGKEVSLRPLFVSRTSWSTSALGHHPLTVLVTARSPSFTTTLPSSQRRFFGDFVILLPLLLVSCTLASPRLTERSMAAGHSFRPPASAWASVNQSLTSCGCWLPQGSTTFVRTIFRRVSTAQEQVR